MKALKFPAAYVYFLSHNEFKTGQILVRVDQFMIN